MEVWMLNQSFVSLISSEVADVRVQKGLDRKKLADRSDVGVRFLKNLEEGVEMPWDRTELIQKLLRVLNALSLQDTAQDVKKAVKKSARKPRFRRMKFDKGFQVALSKKGCRMR